MTTVLAFYKCRDCREWFFVEVIEDSIRLNEVKFCPFCGGNSVGHGLGAYYTAEVKTES